MFEEIAQIYTSVTEVSFTQNEYSYVNLSHTTPCFYNILKPMLIQLG